MERHDIGQRIQEGQEFCRELSRYANDNIVFEGKTLGQWRREFWVKIPEDMNFAALAKLSALIAAKYQHAAFYRDTQNISLVVLEQTQKDIVKS